jgi:cytochrome c oxidase subunit IV
VLLCVLSETLLGATMKNENAAIKSEAHTEKHEASLKSYIFIWSALIILTAVTVTSAKMNFGKITILIVLSIAAIKATLVFLYFMHLRYEKRLLIKLLIPGAIVLLAIFIGLTFTDVLAR